MTAPDSRVGGSAGWALIIAVILVAVYDTGYKPKRTLYYHYRPETSPKLLQPWLTGLIWTAALVLIAVSYVYFLTVEANSGWVNELFPGQKYGYDVMAALILVNLFLIKAWPAFFCTMDAFHFMMVGRSGVARKEKAVSPEGGEGAFFTTGAASSNRAGLFTESYRGRTQPVNVASQAKADAAIELKQFESDAYVYHSKNYFVKWGTFVYAVAVLAFGVTVYAFFITKINSSANDSHSYRVSTWTYFVAMIVQVFGLVYTIYVNFEKEVYGFTAELVEERKKELILS